MFQTPLQPMGPKPCSRHAAITGMTNDIRAGALPTWWGALSTQGTLGVALTCWQEKEQDKVSLMVLPAPPCCSPLKSGLHTHQGHPRGAGPRCCRQGRHEPQAWCWGGQSWLPPCCLPCEVPISALWSQGPQISAQATPSHSLVGGWRVAGRGQ